MTTQTLTLTEFLLARIADDQAAAETALSAEADYSGSYFGDTAATAALGLAESEGADARVTDHFARHDPARVLAECAAKRAIVEWHRPSAVDLPTDSLDWSSEPVCVECSNGEDGYSGQVEYPCRTVMALAAIYADHPDFNPAWA